MDITIENEMRKNMLYMYIYIYILIRYMKIEMNAQFYFRKNNNEIF